MTVVQYDEIFNHVQKYLDKGKIDKAFNTLNKLSKDEIETADDTTKLFYDHLLGKTYLLRTQYESAKHYFTKAISLYEALKFKYPSYIEILVLNAFANDALDKRDEAIRWYRKALIKGKVIEHSNDLDNNCYLNLGNIYNERGDYNLAKEYYKKIKWIDTLQRVDIHEDYYGKVTERYLQLAKSCNWEKAKDVNDSLTNYCIIKFGETSDFYLGCLSCDGTIQNSLGEFSKAIITYTNIINIGKRHNLITYDIGNAYCCLIELICIHGKVDDAISLLPEATKYIKNLSNDSVSENEPYLFIGIKCVNIEDYEAGIIVLEKFLSSTPHYMYWSIPYAINKLTWAYLNVGRYQEIVNLLSPILSKENNQPDSFQSVRPHLHKTLGCSLYFLKQKNEAIFNLEEAIRLSNGDLASDSLIQEILSEYSVK